MNYGTDTALTCENMTPAGRRGSVQVHLRTVPARSTYGVAPNLLPLRAPKTHRLCLVSGRRRAPFVKFVLPLPEVLALLHVADPEGFQVQPTG